VKPIIFYAKKPSSVFKTSEGFFFVVLNNDQTFPTMSAIALKTELHRLIDEADDETQLQTWLHLLSGSPQPDEEPELTPEWEARIQKSLQSFREGRYITHEEMKKRAKEWLKK